MKSKTFYLLFCLFFALCTVFTSGVAGAETKYLNFGSSSPGGIWYYIGGGLAPIWTRDIKGLNVVAEATAGDLENARRLGKGEVDISMNHSPTLKSLYYGTGDFKEPHKNVRLVFAIYKSPVSICVLKKSDIKTLSDLAGKKIAMGPPGSGSGKSAKKLFEAIGLWDKITPRYIGYQDGATALKEGHVDCLFQNGAPAANVLSVEATHPIRLLGLTDKEAEQFLAKYPGYVIRDLAPKTYESIDYPVKIFWTVVFVDTNDSVEEKWIYEIVKDTFKEKEKGTFNKIHVLMKQIEPGIEPAKELGIPFHPGAVKYYKEKGLM